MVVASVASSRSKRMPEPVKSEDTSHKMMPKKKRTTGDGGLEFSQSAHASNVFGTAWHEHVAPSASPEQVTSNKEMDALDLMEQEMQDD